MAGVFEISNGVLKVDQLINQNKYHYINFSKPDHNVMEIGIYLGALELYDTSNNSMVLKVSPSSFEYNGYGVIHADNIGSQSVNYASNAGALNGFGSDNFLRRLPWIINDGNNVNNIFHGVTFAYVEHNAPVNGPFCSFGANSWLSPHVLQLSARYNAGGKYFAYRTYDGDTGSWNPWYRIQPAGDTLNTKNYGSSLPSSASTGDLYFKIT